VHSLIEQQQSLPGKAALSRNFQDLEVAGKSD